MRRDIINASALQDYVEFVIAEHSSVMGAWASSIRATVRGIAESHRSVRPARRRRQDPNWAKLKFDEQRLLYRFCETEAEHLNSDLRETLKDLAYIAQVAAGCGSNAPEAESFLRGLPHIRPDEIQIANRAESLREAEEVNRLQVRRHEVLREATTHHGLGLIGTRCVSLDEVIALGRGARNCLKHDAEHWRRFMGGQSDFWVLRDGDRIAAVLESRCSDGRLLQAQAPGNAEIARCDSRPVAAFCLAAGLRVGQEDFPDLQPEFIPDPLLSQTVIYRDWIATYDEWPDAVRIAVAGPSSRPFRSRRFRRNRKLVMTIPNDRPVAVAIVEGQDLPALVEEFGKKTLRKIVSQVALAQTTPSLVQHRLLALAA